MVARSRRVKLGFFIPFFALGFRRRFAGACDNAPRGSCNSQFSAVFDDGSLVAAAGRRAYLATADCGTRHLCLPRRPGTARWRRKTFVDMRELMRSRVRMRGLGKVEPVPKYTATGTGITVSVVGKARPLPGPQVNQQSTDRAVFRIFATRHCCVMNGP